MKWIPPFNLSYREVETTIIGVDEKDIILIGFATTIEKVKDGEFVVNHSGRSITEKKIIINPKSSADDEFSKNYKFKKGDSLFLISYEKPAIETYFIKGNK